MSVRGPLLFLLAALLNESVLSALSRHQNAGAMVYVGLKFAVLPVAALGLLGLSLRQLRRREPPPETRGPLLGLAFGSAYLIVLYVWPLPWAALLGYQVP